MKIKMLITLIMGLLLTTGCKITTIDSGQSAVKVVAGKADKKVIAPGFFFSLNPFVKLAVYNTKAKMVDMNSKNYNKFDTKEIIYERPITILTTENLTVDIDVSVLYKVKSEKLVDIYINYGKDKVWEDKLIIKKARAVIREAIGKASVYELNKNRSVYETKIISTLQARLGEFLTIEQVNINNIPLPKKIIHAVEEKMVESEKAKKETYRLKTIKIQAEQEIARKTGQAKAQEILKKTITKEMIEWRQLDLVRIKLANQKYKISRWNGILPTTVVSGKSGLLLNIK